MNHPLRVLVVSDSETAAAPLLESLRQGGLEPAWRPPQHAGRPLPAMDDQPDLVLVAPEVLARFAAPPEANLWLQASLAEQRQQMHVLSGRLAGLEENASRRLSQELHDRLGQHLTALGLSLGLLRSQLGETAPAAQRQQIDYALSLTEDMAGQVRDVMVALHPPELDEYGLVAALRWHAARFTKHTGLAVAVEGDELAPRLPLIVETALFRIAQAGLSNVLRHAQAHQVTLRMESLPQSARLIIADDGQGFSAQRPRGLGERPRWGLITMRERAETVGGTMRIESKPGAGTRLIVEVAR